MGSRKGSTMRYFTLYRSFNIVRVIKFRRLRWAGHVEEDRRAFKILIVKPRRRWEDNMRMDL